MESAALFAPWRMEYIRSLEKPKDDGCFLCAAAAAADPSQRRQRLVLWTTPHTLVLMNRFPYANGHLLVAPRAHKADPGELSPAEHLDLAEQTTRALTLLRRAVSAQGFNLGVNLGRCAGAGVPGHLHHHVVPRWGGDVNFMAVVGEVRIIPEAISQLYEELLATCGTPCGTGFQPVTNSGENPTRLKSERNPFQYEYLHLRRPWSREPLFQFAADLSDRVS